MRDIKGFMERTLEDTVGFIQVHIRSLERLRDDTEDESRAAGIQDAIDLLNDSCQKGREVFDDLVSRRVELLQNRMDSEAADADHPALEACGHAMNKKVN
jgi:hypothetical protein